MARANEYRYSEGMPSPAHEIIAANVKRLRDELGWSQADLAERAGIHRPNISSLERAASTITVLKLEKVAEALEVEPYELLMEVE